MLSILINAYACSPNMGSEPGMAWNWCVNLAKYCELHIITEGEFCDKIEAVVPTLPQGGNMHFYYNPVSEEVRRMCWNQGDWRFYKHYRTWQYRTYEMTLDIMKMHHIDIRKAGSGNSGSTNALRVMGLKAGLMTFAGDVLKCFAAVLIVRAIYHGSNILPLLMMYAGAGVTLGHNFPFYMNFKGGKGIAVMAALVVSNCFWHLPYSSILFFVTLAFFLVPVLVTRYVSLGSLLAYAVFFIQMVIFGQLGWFDMAKGAVYELYVITFLLTALAWYRHRANIKRLLNGTENKFGSKK